MDLSKGSVFWREPQNQAIDNSGRPHHWVVLTDPVLLKGVECVLWVPLSSYKAYIDYPPETYVFNVGKYNKYIDAKRNSTANVRFAEVVTLAEIEAEGPKRQHRIRQADVLGICRQLKRSEATPEDARQFYADHGIR